MVGDATKKWVAASKVAKRAFITLGRTHSALQELGDQEKVWINRKRNKVKMQPIVGTDTQKVSGAEDGALGCWACDATDGSRLRVDGVPPAEYRCPHSMLHLPGHLLASLCLLCGCIQCLWWNMHRVGVMFVWIVDQTRVWVRPHPSVLISRCGGHIQSSTAALHHSGRQRQIAQRSARSW